jgi:class 3 adenylate cyclase
MGVIGARVGALADGGEVLVSQTVKDLVAGAGIEFEEHGEHELKGVSGDWRLYSLAGVGQDA